MSRRLLFVVAMVTALTLITAGSALAEGSWSSYISGWVTGHSSRNWDKNVNDGVHTTIKLTGCHQSNHPETPRSPDLELWHVYSLWPDSSVAVRHYGSCYSAAQTNDFTYPNTGTYHFTLKKIDGLEGFGMILDVNSVVVNY
ncbi:MAG TPA: hypothetical protein VKU87_06680 [Thermomicrobiaceae bacterium]|nr:hypothetical protein [Thermomicrobiaceae bacterium]